MNKAELMNRDVYVKLHGIAKPVSAKLKYLDESLIAIQGEGLPTELAIATGEKGLPPSFKNSPVYFPIARVEWLMIGQG